MARIRCENKRYQQKWLGYGPLMIERHMNTEIDKHVNES